MDCEFTNFLTKSDRRLEGVRVRAVTVESKCKKITVDLAYQHDLIPDVQERLKQLCEDFIGMEGWDLLIVAEKSHYNTHILEQFIADEVKNYPSISALLQADAFKISNRHITISCGGTVYTHLVSIKFDESLAESLNKHFSDTFTVSLHKTEEVNLDDLAKSLETDIEIPTDDDKERRIRVFEVERLLDDLFGNEAYYIKDISYARDVVLCGRVSMFKELTAKRTGKVFFAFKLTDPTASIEVVIFPAQAKLKKLREIKDGEQVILKGKSSVETDDRGKQRIKVVASNIAYCKLPKTFEEVVYKKPVPRHYVNVNPQPFERRVVQLTFGDLLTPKKEVIPRYFENRTFVVFDLETTGTDRAFDKITEIGAIKLVNGKVTEQFSTLVDPEILIPLNVTEITGIDNLMVAGKPTIDEVIADFYKFCDGATLVAHNAGFDTAFIKRFGQESGYFFDHEVVDTLELSREVLPQNRYHNLAVLAEHFGVVNRGAHRAVNDCEVLVDIFIELIKLSGK